MSTILKRIEISKNGEIKNQKTYFAKKETDKNGVKYWISELTYVEQNNINRDILISDYSVRWEIAGITDGTE